jgi:transcriptional regulator with XRE-family HTH domain
MRFHHHVPATRTSASVERRSAELRRALGHDIAGLRRDSGISQRRLARAVGISQAFLWDIEAGRTEPSSAVVIAIADALGASPSWRIYPGTGPRIRDHLQAAITNELVRIAHARWRKFPEVPVYRPDRGVIDVVLHEPDEHLLVATEVESDLRRLEQEIRWANQKALALRSADVYAFAATHQEPSISRLLVVRVSASTLAVAREYEHLLAAAYPASTAAAFEALVGTAVWPGAAILWADVSAGRARIRSSPPRGVEVGR